MLPISRRFILFSLVAFCAFPLASESEQYPVLNGHIYNGKYYPRVDIIEWGTPPHLEFHVYSKEEPIEISAKTTMHNGRRVLLVSYHFTLRKEKLCRRVLAPANFTPEASLYFYKDTTDEEYDNIFISVGPMKSSKTLDNYLNRPYKRCLPAVPKKKIQERKVASSPAPSAPASAPATLNPNLANPGALTTPAPTHELIEYENHALPFNY